MVTGKCQIGAEILLNLQQKKKREEDAKTSFISPIFYQIADVLEDQENTIPNEFDIEKLIEDVGLIFENEHLELIDNAQCVSLDVNCTDEPGFSSVNKVFSESYSFPVTSPKAGTSTWVDQYLEERNIVDTISFNATEQEHLDSDKKHLSREYTPTDQLDSPVPTDIDDP